MVKKKINVIREEMLQVATNVAQEKNIDQDSVFSAMEQALEKLQESSMDMKLI